MSKRKHRGGSSDRSSSRSDRSGPSTPGSFSDRPYGKGGTKPRTAKGAHGKPAGRPSFGRGEASFGRGEAAASREDRPSFGKRPGKAPFRQGQTGQGQTGKPAREGSAHGKAAPRFAKDLRTKDPRKRQPDGSERRPAALNAAAEPRAEPASTRPARPGRNQVWLYGLHAVKAALANPRRRHHRLLLTDEATEALGGEPKEINGLKPEVMDRDTIGRFLPPGAVHQGAALLAEPLTDVALEDIIDQAADAEKSVILILDQVTDPQNVGAILRSAAAFGAAAVVVPDRHAPPETGALVKAASGAVELVPLVRVVNLARAMEDIKAAGFWCAGLDGQAPQSLAAADMTGKIALVLGAEGEGLRRLTRDHCDILVHLPISERMESLNVSAAAAVALYELARKA